MLRRDQQVKIQGYRIELGESEDVLRQEGSVLEVAAIAWPIKDGKPQGIVAFVAGSDLEIETLLQKVKARVPSYMVPREIYPLKTLPYNLNGKIDRPAFVHLLSEELQEWFL